MKGNIKRNSKVVALTGAEVVIENTSRVFHKTLGRMGRSVAHTYWENRAWELNDEIHNCPDCEADSVMTGYHWKHMVTPLGGGPRQEKGVFNQYCDTHAPEAERIIKGYSKTSS